MVELAHDSGSPSQTGGAGVGGLHARSVGGEEGREHGAPREPSSRGAPTDAWFDPRLTAAAEWAEVAQRVALRLHECELEGCSVRVRLALDETEQRFLDERCGAVVVSVGDSRQITVVLRAPLDPACFGQVLAAQLPAAAAVEAVTAGVELAARRVVELVGLYADLFRDDD